MMRILVAGGSGAIGLPLVRHLREADHEVLALHRNDSGAALLREAGARPIQADALDLDSLGAALAGCRVDAVISQLTALKKAPARHRDMARTDELRTHGTANLVEIAHALGAKRFVTQSMVFGYGYGDFRGRTLDETDTFAPPGNGRFEAHLAAMRTNEQLVLQSRFFEGVALRYGLFYGPGAAGDALLDGLRRRRIPVVRDAGVQPWVYIEDAAAATVAALTAGAPGSAYNIVDDEPVSLPDLMIAMAARIGAPPPRRIPWLLLKPMPYAAAVLRGGLRVSNAKAKRELGWELVAPTYREGLELMQAKSGHARGYR